MDVDATQSENQHPTATPDSGEDIEVVTVPLNDLSKALQSNLSMIITIIIIIRQLY